MISQAEKREPKFESGGGHKFERTWGEFSFERIRANSNLHPDCDQCGWFQFSILSFAHLGSNACNLLKRPKSSPSVEPKFFGVKT